MDINSWDLLGIPLSPRCFHQYIPTVLIIVYLHILIGGFKHIVYFPSYIWDNPSQFFKMVKTTNQYYMYYVPIAIKLGRSPDIAEGIQRCQSNAR